MNAMASRDLDWTPALEAVLRIDYLSGATGESIARRITSLAGRTVTRSAVVRKAQRLGLKRDESVAALGAVLAGKRHAKAMNARRRKAYESGPDGGPNPDLRPLKPVRFRAAGIESRTLVLLEAGCKFPVGSASGLDQMFCGKPKDAKEPYCPRCTRWAYKPKRKPC